MDSFQLFVVGITTITSILLIYFGIHNYRKNIGDKTKASLMVLVGLITALNLILWVTMPEAPKPFE